MKFFLYIGIPLPYLRYYVVIGIFGILTCHCRPTGFQALLWTGALENVPELQVWVKGECSLCLNETLYFSNN